MSYSIKIYDNKNEIIGERMNATSEDVLAYINKGFKVFDISTQKWLSEEDVSKTIAVSECAIIL